MLAVLGSLFLPITFVAGVYGARGGEQAAARVALLSPTNGHHSTRITQRHINQSHHKPPSPLPPPSPPPPGMNYDFMPELHWKVRGPTHAQREHWTARPLLALQPPVTSTLFHARTSQPHHIAPTPPPTPPPRTPPTHPVWLPVLLGRLPRPHRCLPDLPDGRPRRRRPAVAPVDSGLLQGAREEEGEGAAGAREAGVIGFGRQVPTGAGGLHPGEGFLPLCSCLAAMFFGLVRASALSFCL
jgi:hypothetical protein